LTGSNQRENDKGSRKTGKWRKKQMTRTVVALYDDIHQAHDAVRDLTQSGIPRENISLVSNDAEGTYQQQLERGGGRTREGSAQDTAEDAGKGAGVGAVLGGLGGLVVGLGALAIPGIGPIVAAGPIATTLAGAGIGAATGGLIGALTNLGVPEEHAEHYAEGVRRGGTLVTVEVDDAHVDRAVSVLNKHNPVDIERRRQHWQERGGYKGFDREGQGMTHDQIQKERRSMPIVEEDLQVGKRDRETGHVSVHRSVTEKPVEKDVDLRSERVNVERRDVNRPVNEGEDVFKEETFEFTEHTEEPTARKESRVVGEVDISKETDTHRETIQDKVRRSDVEVDRSGTEGRMAGDHDRQWRTHFQSMNRQGRFEDYQPAYRFGHEMAGREDYRNRDWRDVEHDMRRHWEQRNPDYNWNEYRDYIRGGYEGSRRTR
jgi:stress response protein YsnF